jgi:hypothetical protein
LITKRSFYLFSQIGLFFPRDKGAFSFKNRRSMFSGMFRRRQAVDPAAAESPGSYEVPLYTNAAYYPNWRVYKKQPPSSLRLGFISHVFYAFAWYAANHL